MNVMITLNKVYLGTLINIKRRVGEKPDLWLDNRKKILGLAN